MAPLGRSWRQVYLSIFRKKTVQICFLHWALVLPSASCWCFCICRFFPNTIGVIGPPRYFVDPITLPCYTVVLLGLYLFGDSSKIPTKVSNFAKLLISILTIYIAIESQSRSSWVAGIALANLSFVFLQSLVNETDFSLCWFSRSVFLQFLLFLMFLG